jgi:uncharacterized membrane protein
MPLPIPACNLDKKTYNDSMQQPIPIWARTIPWKGLTYLIVGILFLGWLLTTPPGLLGKADAIAYAVCHRISERSFHVGDRQFPLCARCAGMYLGAILGLFFQGRTTRRRAGTPPWRVLIVLGFFVAAFGVDGLNSYLHIFPGMPSLYTPNNTLRLLTGTGMGLTLAAALYPAFNQTVWKVYDERPALGGLRPLAILVLLALLLDFVTLSGNPLLLYPLALLSAAGVLLLLTMIYTMAWMMLLHWENRYQTWFQMNLPAIAGFGMALLQIGLLDLVRYFITGTWDGFHLG